VIFHKEMRESLPAAAAAAAGLSYGFLTCAEERREGDEIPISFNC
jgi:hypothetical protein